MTDTSNDVNSIYVIRHKQHMARSMDSSLKFWSEIAADENWTDVLLSLDKARSALLDKMSPEYRAIAEET